MVQNSIPEQDIISFAIQLCELFLYLHSLHRPILYLDLKPDNILVSDKNIKLIDFGAASYVEELKKRSYSLGTKGFAAPEQYGMKEPDTRSDIYSIGMIMFYLVTGQTAGADGIYMNKVDMCQAYSESLKDIINKCMKYNPSHRYSTIERLLLQLYRQRSLRKKGIFNRFLMRRSYLHIPKEEQFEIAIAGTQAHIGVTHISLCLCSYMNRQRYRAVYADSSAGGTVESIIKYSGLTAKTFGIIKMHDCRLYYGRNSELTDIAKGCVVIKDYGVLTDRNREDFCRADVKLLIMGSKEWERRHTETTLRALDIRNDIICLFNWTEGRVFKRISADMDGFCCYRIPYIPAVFDGRLSLLKDFFHEILCDGLMGRADRALSGKNLFLNPFES